MIHVTTYAIQRYQIRSATFLIAMCWRCYRAR